MEQAAEALPQSARPDQKMAALPALPPAAFGMGTPSEDQSRIGQRLEAVQAALMESLQARREAARQDEILEQQDVWRREARSRFALSTGETSGAPDLELQVLQANVATLTRTVANWKASLPPAPRLEDLQTKVAAEQVRLAALLAERAQQQKAALAQHQEERQKVRENRAAYVQTQADALATKLEADDAQVVAAQSTRLTEQRSALLAELARPPLASVSSFGFTGAETLPHGPGAATASLSQASLLASEIRLRAQRARWVQFIRVDTQAAAQDTAAKNGWDVTFGPRRPGDRDLTAAMTQAMASSVWRL